MNSPISLFLMKYYSYVLEIDPYTCVLVYCMNTDREARAEREKEGH